MVLIKEYTLTTGRDSLQKITGQIKEAVSESGIKDGIAVAETSHSTSGILKITVTGNEVLEDIVKEMRKIIPARINYLHQDGPENAAGHIKSALFGTSVSMIIKDGKLLIEDKQDVCFADYDGPQIRTYRVCVIGE